MAYGFFLRVILSPYGRFQSDEQADQELVLAAPIGTIKLTGSPAGTSVRNAESLLFTGKGYATLSDAETAGRTLKGVVQLASIDSGIPLDAGLEKIQNNPGRVLIDTMAEQGIQLLPKVHGLLVFEETGIPTSLSIKGEMQVSSSLPSFSSALKVRSHSGVIPDEKQYLAGRLYGLSRFETSLRSRLLTLVTALDVMADNEERTGASKDVVYEILEIVKRRLVEIRKGRANYDEISQLDSLVSAVGNLKYKSTSASIKDLARNVDRASIFTQRSPEEVVREAYAARNQLIHGGHTTIDLAQLIEPLDSLVAELCAGGVISAKDAAQILQCSETTVLRSIRNGLINAVKRSGRWEIRPRMLEQFMATRLA